MSYITNKIMYYLKVLRDLFFLTTINLPNGQLHGLLFMIIPFNIWLRQSKIIFNYKIFIKLIISLISCFNFELLNVISGKIEKINDIRENNLFINENYKTTFLIGFLLQLFFSSFLNLFDYDPIIFINITIISITTYLYTIKKWSSNGTFKSFYAAFIAIGIHPLVMIEYINFHKCIVGVHLLTCSFIWMIIDFTQDIKDIEIDEKEKRITSTIIMFKLFGEKKSIYIFSTIIFGTSIFMYKLLENHIITSLFLNLGSIFFILSSYIENKFSKKYYYKLCWNYIAAVFIYWIFQIPTFEENDCNSLINFENGINFNFYLLLIHYIFYLIGSKLIK